MIAIDTNVIVRYLTGDHPEQSPRARALVETLAGTGGIFVPVTVALETEWVLRSAYGFSPAEIAGAIRAFAGLPGVEIEDAALVAEALQRNEAGMDFADALHLGRSAHCSGFASFDRRFIKSAKALGRVDAMEA